MTISSEYYPNEPERPILKSIEPSEETINQLNELSKVFDTRAVYFIADYEKSIGNYICDLDGNYYLDLYQQIASIALGYNNPLLIEAAKSQEMIESLVERPAMGNFPSKRLPKQLQNLLRFAPNGQNKIWSGLSGSDANELAFKAAFMYYCGKKRGFKTKYTEDENASVMDNQAPGSPDLAVLSFKNAFHGRLFATASVTCSKPIHKLDLPAFNWPHAPYPVYKYPLEDNQEFNKKVDDECVLNVEEIIKTWYCPVAALIIEPIQSEGGDNHASALFFAVFERITLKYGIVYIIDEVQTGVGATGKMWCHEHAAIEPPPDLVTFSKKFQSAGYFFHDPDFIPNMKYRQFNTWCGDPARFLIANVICEEIVKKDLITHVNEVGDYLMSKLTKLAVVYPNYLQRLRGANRATFIAWDVENNEQRDELLALLKSNGCNVGGCSTKSIRLRPSLTFDIKHADIFIEALEKSLYELSA
ncbi:hypothetical protein TPHA_0K01360 [Tetrapisispora phaffii CBS 4417]|uniref:4-aminobutyrate aminotransferase n=1 Tax=Tetrapisispora phaffii (strain ATCC 24235 / CBS 4417 / NBRC 1672 / NRRL Y-8282 / UCD 70-5) TaxID=1071381 RepID=G8BZE1_TETPH|nr:hypothetical protein TPHA_0K01360 [Tetrapisispora phaffii CBS 4417]CCE65269.1 hypothetical protein TPHA_0K01360 [Tetrapisispora phaffii CBS 4417]